MVNSAIDLFTKFDLPQVPVGDIDSLIENMEKLRNPVDVRVKSNLVKPKAGSSDDEAHVHPIVGNNKYTKSQVESGEALATELAKINQMYLHLGNPEMESSLAVAYFLGQGVEQNTEKALVHFKSAASKNHGKAAYCLGMIYSEGIEVPKDDKAALSYFELSALKGNIAAQLNVASLYKDGIGVKENTPLAAKYFEFSANGYLSALFSIARIYRDGIGLTRKRPDLEDKCYELASILDSESSVELALAFTNNFDRISDDYILKFDPKRAIKYLEFATDYHHNGEASYILGEIYSGGGSEWGLFFEKDISKAKRYYELARTYCERSVEYGNTAAINILQNINIALDRTNEVNLKDNKKNAADTPPQELLDVETPNDERNTASHRTLKKPVDQEDTSKEVSTEFSAKGAAEKPLGQKRRKKQNRTAQRVDFRMSEGMQTKVEALANKDGSRAHWYRSTFDNYLRDYADLCPPAFHDSKASKPSHIDLPSDLLVRIDEAAKNVQLSRSAWMKAVINFTLNAPHPSHNSTPEIH